MSSKMMELKLKVSALLIPILPFFNILMCITVIAIIINLGLSLIHGFFNFYYIYYNLNKVEVVAYVSDIKYNNVNLYGEAYVDYVYNGVDYTSKVSCEDGQKKGDEIKILIYPDTYEEEVIRNTYMENIIDFLSYFVALLISIILFVLELLVWFIFIKSTKSVVYEIKEEIEDSGYFK